MKIEKEYTMAVDLFKSLNRKPSSERSKFDEEFIMDFLKLNTNFTKNQEGIIQTYRHYNAKVREFVSQELSKLYL